MLAVTTLSRTESERGDEMGCYLCGVHPRGFNSLDDPERIEGRAGETERELVDGHDAQGGDMYSPEFSIFFLIL
jgi:hypothetical protein